MSTLFHGFLFLVHLTIVDGKGQTYALTQNDMATIVSYTQHAVVPITFYLDQYGSNYVDVKPVPIEYKLTLDKDVLIESKTITDIATAIFQSLPPNSSLVIPFPPVPPALIGDNYVNALSSNNSANGYHGFLGSKSGPANLSQPYTVIWMNGQFSSNTYSGDLIGNYGGGVTVKDQDQIYAPQLSAQVAQMIADPLLSQTEVCIPCGPVKVGTKSFNDTYQYYNYFDYFGNYLGSDIIHSNRLVFNPFAFPFIFDIAPKYYIYISAISKKGYALPFGTTASVINGVGNAAPQSACAYADSVPLGVTNPPPNPQSSVFVILQQSDGNWVRMPVSKFTDKGPIGDPVIDLARIIQLLSGYFPGVQATIISQ